MHKTSRKLGGDWITVKQSKTFRNKSVGTNVSSAITVLTDDYLYKMPIFAVYNVELNFSYVAPSTVYYLNVYKDEWGIQELGYVTTNTNPSKKMVFVFAKILTSYYCARNDGDTSIYVNHSAEHKGNLYLTTRDGAGSANITVNTTVKYLNFDS